MAKVDHFDKGMIRALQETVDFYYWKGIPVARAWPDWSNFKPSARQRESMAAMKESRQAIAEVGADLRELYRSITTGRKAAWLDILTGTFMRGWKVARTAPPVMTGITIEDVGEKWIVKSKWTHSSEIYAAIILGVHEDEPEWKEKKGGVSECTEPPFGPILPDPETPPYEPPKPLLIPGTLVEGEYIEVAPIWLGARLVYWAMEGDADPEEACRKAWETLKWKIENGWYSVYEGQYLANITAIRVNNWPRSGSTGVQITDGWTRYNFLMGPWYTYSPDKPPASVKIRIYNPSEHLGGVMEWDGIPEPFALATGWNIKTFAFPGEWWGGATAGGWFGGSTAVEFCPAIAQQSTGLWPSKQASGEWVRLYEEPKDIEYEHEIPKDVVEDEPDPRLIFYWDYIEEFLRCPVVPIPVRKIAI